MNDFLNINYMCVTKTTKHLQQKYLGYYSFNVNRTVESALFQPDTVLST